MLIRKSHKALMVAFFCSWGWVCNDPVSGAEATAVDDAAAVNAAVAAARASDSNESSSDTARNQVVSVTPLGQIELHVKELELAKVLQILSIQSKRNIIASKSVAGNVSADLYGVDFYEAMDAILHANGMGYVEKGNFIYVYTQAEIKTISEAERKMSSRVMRLNYISAADASAFVQPMLSQGAQISVSTAATPGFNPSLTDGGANTFAHPDTLVLRDYPESLDEIVRVIRELDVRPKQVLVEATVLQAALTENNAFGVDLSILVDTDFTHFVSPLNVIDSLIGGKVTNSAGTASTATPYSVVGNSGGVQTGVGNTGAPGGTKVGILSKNVSAFVRALDEVTDTTVLAKPKLLVLNRQKADLLVGDKLGYLSTTATDTSATQTVEFLEVGTKLTLRPFISDEGFIRMELKPAISSGETVQVGNSGTVIPNEHTQELTTNVMVRSGQTVILGGLFKEDTTVTRRQTPFVGDLPIVGAAFKGQDDTHKRSEVIFLITSTIMKDQSQYAAGDSAKETIESARLGAREGLLPFSRTKLTASHMREAMDHMNKGEKDKALWSANMALTLDPTSIEAIKMREELTGQRMYWPDRGMLDASIDKYIDKQIQGPAATQPTGPAKSEKDVKPATSKTTAAVPTPAIAPAPATLAPVTVKEVPVEKPQSVVTQQPITLPEVIEPAPAQVQSAPVKTQESQAAVIETPAPAAAVPAVETAPISVAPAAMPEPVATAAPAPIETPAAPEPAAVTLPPVPQPTASVTSNPQDRESVDRWFPAGKVINSDAGKVTNSSSASVNDSTPIEQSR